MHPEYLRQNSIMDSQYFGDYDRESLGQGSRRSSYIFDFFISDESHYFTFDL